MDMEQRKVNWRNRIHDTGQGFFTTKEISLLVSICQDAFNEGHKEGQKDNRGFGIAQQGEL